MIKALSFEEFEILAKKSPRVAVFKEIAIGELSALDVYEVLSKNNFTHGILLEDLQQRDGFINSYIGFNPIEIFTADKKKQDFLETIKDFQKKIKFETRQDVVNLITSAAGFISYDAIRFFENIPDRHPEGTFPLALLKFFSVSITLNHKTKRALISVLTDVREDTSQNCFSLAQDMLNDIEEILASYSPSDYSVPLEVNSNDEITVDCSDEEFMRMVTKAKDYIVKGDAFQIVLSRSFQREINNSPLNIYKVLRHVSPAPFLFYIPLDSNDTIIGASPERFIQVIDRDITANPIAGTRQRDVVRDEQIKQDLLSDEKEIAEHMMLVDLTRNDVGSVSEPASVKVKELLNIQHYSHVTHITSTIIGKLREEFSPLDAIKNAFPVGTLSGAPKIRAMEIIDELEKSRRGLYGGAVLRLDGVFDVDSAVAIRMAHLKDNVATVRTGAGIVFDSDPQKEMRETYQKARPLLKALQLAHQEVAVQGEVDVIDN